MSLIKIMSISGLPGLFKVIAQTKNGFIAESLVDKKRFPVSSNQQVSMLSDISIFTTGGDVKLVEVFKTMKKMPAADTHIDTNAEGAAIRAAFKKILPEFDEERVYPSDMKKVFKWFGLLKDTVDFDEVLEEKKEETTSNEPELKSAVIEDVAENADPAVKPKRKTKKVTPEKK
jgi:hypothetical protein